jgi:16S rRNA (uracil1498-N3)-methyltransferase
VFLSAEETHHLAGVLRLTVGAEVLVFDGRGREWLARVSAIDRRAARLSVVDQVAPAAPEAAVGITLGQAALRGDRMDAVVRDATMLGVERIRPLVSAHANLSTRPADLQRAIARWRRVAIASCKQCGRARLPDVECPVSVEGLLQEALPPVRLLLVEPRGALDATSSIDELHGNAREGGAVVLVGPEGGWSAQEIQALIDVGFRAWSLGPVTLRADAVAVAALSVLRYVWRE